MSDPHPSTHQQALARQRAQLIMQVRSGVLSARKQPGNWGSPARRITSGSAGPWQRWSRHWAIGTRALAAPIDPEKEALQRQTQALQAQLDVLQQTERIRQVWRSRIKKRLR